MICNRRDKVQSKPTLRRFGLLIFMVLSFALSSCGDVTNQTASSDPKQAGTLFTPTNNPASKTETPAKLKIAYAGPTDETGQKVIAGVKLAVQEWNERKAMPFVELIIADDKRDSQQAIKVANELVRENVVGVIGHTNSGPALAAANIYLNAAGGAIPLISPSATNTQLTERGYTNFFRVIGRDDLQGNMGAELVHNVFSGSIKNVYIITDRQTYGTGLAGEFRRRWWELGGIICDTQSQVVAGAITDEMIAVIKKELETEKVRPDLIYYGGVSKDAAILVKKLRLAGVTQPYFMSGETLLTNGPFLAQLATEGGISLDKKILATNFQSAFQEAPAQQFGAKIRTDFQIEPSQISYYGYDATNVLLNALATVRTDDKAAIIKALQATNHKGITGPISFDAKGDRKNAVVELWEAKKGNFELLNAGSKMGRIIRF